MLDGLKIFYPLNDFQVWREAVNIEFFTPTDIKTGRIKEKIRSINGVTQKTITHYGNFETYQLTVKETYKTQVGGQQSVSFLLILNGSLHKNHFAGTNYSPFTWEKLQREINYVETRLQLSGELARLVNLEIGINVQVSFPVFPFLQMNLIGYKGQKFNYFHPDKKGVCLGCVCDLRQYSVKTYDKGKQFGLPEPLMRFELRFRKMQLLKKSGINTLNDLKDPKKVNRLSSFLIDGWENILLFDTSINLDNPELKPKERYLLLRGSNSTFWEQLKENDTRAFNYQRAKFKKLVALHGKGCQELIKELIKKEWETLFKNCTILPTVKIPELNKFPIKVKGKFVPKGVISLRV